MWYLHLPVPADGSAGPPTDVWTPVLLSLLAGVSTALGGAIVLLLDGEPSKATMSFALSLAGSVMVYVSVELSYHAVLAGGEMMWTGLACLASGAALFGAMQWMLPDSHEHGKDEHRHADEEQPLVAESEAALTARNWRLGLLMLVVLTAHNFPEGLAVAVTAMDSTRLGVVVAIAIAAHNIPEGIVIAVPIYAASKSRSKAIGWALASGLTEPLGALVAVLFLRSFVTEARLQAVLCLVAGMMLAVSVVELFPAAWKYKQPVSFFVGCVAGACIMAATDMLVGH